MGGPRRLAVLRRVSRRAFRAWRERERERERQRERERKERERERESRNDF